MFCMCRSRRGVRAGPAKAESKAKDEPRGKSGLQSLQKLYELSESHV